MCWVFAELMKLGGVFTMTVSKVENCLESKLKFFILVLVFFSSYGIIPAYAYLDPGTSSLIIQGALGALAAAGTTVALYWRKIRSIFRKDGPSDPQVGD